jgi:soluble lytic murein transglycosylase-like protein
LSGGGRVLRAHLAEFGRYDLALAAYNAGRDNVHKYGGIPPFRETQGYVRKVLKYFERYKNTASAAPD